MMQHLSGQSCRSSQRLLALRYRRGTLVRLPVPTYIVASASRAALPRRSPRTYPAQS